jgi:hypothetical protein
MATFDRFDICEAYLALENDWNVGGVLQERPSCQRRNESVGFQLDRIGFHPASFFNGFASLSPNAKEIYNDACQRLGLGDGGYKPCACPDCMETAIGWGHPMCSDCVDAGCDGEGECQAPGAYGGDEDEPDEDDAFNPESDEGDR